VTKSPRDATLSNRFDSTCRETPKSSSPGNFVVRLKNYGTSGRRAIRSRPRHATVTL